MQTDNRIKNHKIGCFMMTEEEFDHDTMAYFRMRKQEGETFFLPGKGWGNEIAIRYDVLRPNGERRKKSHLDVGYRSHSDFELYAVPPDFKTQGANSEFFPTVKGPETFGIPREKILDNLETTLLPDGQKIKTMSVELLMVDKLREDHCQFFKPNNHGRNISDSAALMLSYDDIDRDKVRMFFDRYYIQHVQENARNKANLESVCYGAKSIDEGMFGDKFRWYHHYKKSVLYIKEDWEKSGFLLTGSIKKFFFSPYSGTKETAKFIQDPTNFENGGLSKTGDQRLQALMRSLLEVGIRHRIQSHLQSVEEMNGYRQKLEDFFITADKEKLQLKLKQKKIYDSLRRGR